MWWAPCGKDSGFVWSLHARDGAADGSSRVLGQNVGFSGSSSGMPTGFSHQPRHGQGSADSQSQSWSLSGGVPLPAALYY